MHLKLREMKHNRIDLVIRKKTESTITMVFLDSQYEHSDVDDIEDEVSLDGHDNEDDDDDEQSSDGFRGRVDFGK